MVWWESPLIGIVSGVVSSMIFFILMGGIKPHIKVSSDICRNKENNKVVYRIKIVNLTRSMITNLKYSLLYQIDNKKGVSEIIEIEPKKNVVSYMDAYKAKEDYSDYAIRLTYEYDESAYPLENNTKLVFTIFAQHSFSNTIGYAQKEYGASNVKEGKFETGRSTKII